MCYIAINRRVSPLGVVANVLDCNIGVSKFELHSYYDVHFRTNTLGKGMNSLILSICGLNSTTTVRLQDDFGIW